ncbi:hypothetical protein [Burkholderia sp. Ac-20365]|uniref:hypothetical protein n=1 Tax=Burkholderia sp. Ac-20365 TaxID=2703897 RepID=UPI00197B9EF2|nr:hypothetical protein [Burkholderia sp. Ac-20365]MBN3760894.1 hypothetical protein [Burkholderia sp. Ac-20365]
MNLRFMSRKGHVFNHVINDSDELCTFWYEDIESGRQFDVRELPEAHFGAERADIFDGDTGAHRIVIRRAVDAGHQFGRRAQHA